MKTSLFGIIVQAQPERVVVHSAVLTHSAAPERIVLTVGRAVQTKLNQDHFLSLSGEAWGADLTVLPDKEKWPRQSSARSQTALCFDLGCITGTVRSSLAGARLDYPLPLLLQVPPGRVGEGFWGGCFILASHLCTKARLRWLLSADRWLAPQTSPMLHRYGLFFYFNWTEYDPIILLSLVKAGYYRTLNLAHSFRHYSNHTVHNWTYRD